MIAAIENIEQSKLTDSFRNAGLVKYRVSLPNFRFYEVYQRYDTD
jgi:hypothetical protein